MPGRARVLLVTQFFPPDITAASFRAHGFATWLHRFGFKVAVVTAEPHRVRMDPSQSVAPEPFRVIRTPILEIGARGGLWYALQYISFTISSFLWGMCKLRGKYDYVICTSPPLPIGLSGWMVAKLKRAAFILDVRDLWPDTAIAVGQLPERGLMTSIGKWLEAALYRRADLITCVSSRMAERIRGFPSLSADVEVIYNGIDEPAPQTAGIDRPKPFDSICYVGNVGRCQALEVVLMAASQLPDTRFRIVGTGVRLEELQGMAESMELLNVEFAGSCSRDESLAIMARASALLVHLKDDEVFQYTIPSKVFDYLSAGVPILYGLEGEANHILSKTGGNLKFIAENPHSLVCAVRALLSDYPELAHRARSNPMLLKEFTRKRACERLARILGSISQ